MVYFYGDEEPLVKWCQNPKRQAINYIKNELSWDKDTPIHIGTGIDIQIRIDATVFENDLPEKMKVLLYKHENKDRKTDYVYDDDVAQARWINDSYWDNCDAYIFNITVEGVEIYYQCEYGYDGLEDHKTTIFLKRKSVPYWMWANRDTYERSEDRAFKW